MQVVGFSVLNTVQCYRSSKFVRRTFDGPASATEVTPFAGRLFGSWSFLSGLVRFYAAYNIHSEHLYRLTLCTYLIVLSHFAGELMVYGTMKFGKGLAPSLFVATTSVVWMLTQWSFYVEWLRRGALNGRLQKDAIVWWYQDGSFSHSIVILYYECIKSLHQEATAFVK